MTKNNDADEALKMAIRLGDEGSDLKERVMESPFHSFVYSREILGRAAEGERSVLGDVACLLYARDVVKGRWKEAEPFVARDPVLSLIYATDVVKGRFEEGEEVISQSPFVLGKYAELLGVLPERLHAVAVLMSFDSNEDWIREYFKRYDGRHG